MISWWPGDGNANDIQSGNNGTLQNGATFAAGKVGQAFKLDGVDDAVTINDNTGALNITGNQVSIDSWIKLENNPTTAQNFTGVVGKNVFASGQPYQIVFESGPISSNPSNTLPQNQWQFEYILTNAGGTRQHDQVTGVVVTVDGLYHHFTMTYDGANARLYVDAVLRYTRAFSGNLRSTPTVPVIIGGRAPFSADEVEIFNRGLTQTEIQSIFNADSSGKCKPQPTPTPTPTPSAEPSPLQLILDQAGPASNQAAALDSVLFLRDPFRVVNVGNLFNQGLDRNTRVVIFTNLPLAQGETPSSVLVNLVDSNNQSYDITAEDVRTVPNFSFTQVVFRLPDNLSAGMCTIKLKAHGQESNSGAMTITSTAKPATLMITKTGTGGGTVSSSPTGISCGPTCSATFSSGTSVTLKATADSNSLFAGWSGGGCSGTGDCSLTMNVERSVTASFSKVTLEASTTIGPSGGIVEVTNSSSPLFKTKIDIPPGALDSNTLISIRRITDSPLLPPVVKLSGPSIDFQPDALVFKKPVRITVPYFDSDNDGKIDGANIREEFLETYFLNDLASEWVLSPNRVAQDTASNTVTLEVSHFTPYLDLFLCMMSAETCKNPDLLPQRNIIYLVENNSGHLSDAENIIARSAIGSAFESWNQRLATGGIGIRFVPTTDPASADLLVRWSGDASVFSTFDDSVPGVESTIAITNVFRRLMRLNDRDSFWNPSVTGEAGFSVTGSFPSDCGRGPSQRAIYDLQGIVTHEIGHMLGLPHNGRGTSTMRSPTGPCADSLSLRNIDDLDVAFVASRYNVVVGPTPTPTPTPSPTPVPSPAPGKVIVIVVGNGTVTSFPDGRINCPTVSCSTTYGPNDFPFLIAKPGSGSFFGGWSGTNCFTDSCPLTPNDFKNGLVVTATFVGFTTSRVNDRSTIFEDRFCPMFGSDTNGCRLASLGPVAPVSALSNSNKGVHQKIDKENVATNEMRMCFTSFRKHSANILRSYRKLVQYSVQATFSS